MLFVAVNASIVKLKLKKKCIIDVIKVYMIGLTTFKYALYSIKVLICP